MDYVSKVCQVPHCTGAPRSVPFWNRAQKPQEGRCCCCGRPSDLFVPVVHFVELPALTTEGRARGIGGGGGGDGKGDKSGGIWWISVYCKPLQCRSGCADKPAEIAKSGRNWQSNSKRGIPPAHAMGLIPRIYTCSRGLKNRPVMLLCADQKGHF